MLTHEPTPLNRQQRELPNGLPAILTRSQTDPASSERDAQMKTRHQNRGLRKICDCPRRSWAKCPHSWHFNFKPKGGPSYRFSIDSELDRHIESKSEAEEIAGGDVERDVGKHDATPVAERRVVERDERSHRTAAASCETSYFMSDT